MADDGPIQAETNNERLDTSGEEEDAPDADARFNDDEEEEPPEPEAEYLQEPLDIDNRPE